MKFGTKIRTTSACFSLGCSTKSLAAFGTFWKTFGLGGGLEF